MLPRPRRHCHPNDFQSGVLRGPELEVRTDRDRYAHLRLQLVLQRKVWLAVWTPPDPTLPTDDQPYLVHRAVHDAGCNLPRRKPEVRHAGAARAG